MPDRPERADGPVDTLEQLFANNVAWSKQRTTDNPLFFSMLAAQQTPRYLWVGCADSRVPANEILGLQPGEVFVHRNIANLVVHTDLNCLSVLQFGVEVLKVRHIMVVGHYGCGGIHAVAEHRSTGLTDNWLRHVEDIVYKHAALLESITDDDKRAARLCELNVIEQVANVCRTTVLRRAWYRGQRIEVHGLVYGLSDGLLRRVGVSVKGGQAWERRYAESVHVLSQKQYEFAPASKQLKQRQ
jgi:carbonic anhydrase